MLVDGLSALALAAWLAVLLLPSAPWRTRERFSPHPSSTGEPYDLSRVTVLVPARNEAASLAGTLAALAEQGSDLAVVVIDDQSEDGTAAAARAANTSFARPVALTVVEGQPLPPGWGGKLWALEQGLSHVDREFCLLLDAEIVLAREVLGALLEKAVAEDRAMVSVMATLRCESFWEKLLVPPFIFFFKLLYPFAKVNRPSTRTAAAAGGCILIRTDVLHEIAAFASIRDALIDDCTLAAGVKHAGHSIWLGLSDAVTSSRHYPDLASFRRMVTRTAFTQLRYSFWLLALVVVLMLIMFALPVVSLFTGAWGWLLGAGTLLAMFAAYRPTVRFYGLPSARVLTLPLAALLFLAMTIESALNYWRGVRAEWKGRTYAVDVARGRRKSLL